MATLSIQTKVTLDDFVEAAEQLSTEMESRDLTQDEQNELHELIGLSEAQTAQRLALLLELSQLRRVSLSTLMKQLQIRAADVV